MSIDFSEAAISLSFPKSSLSVETAVILDMIADAVLILDRALFIVYLNAPAARMLRVTQQRAKGQALETLLPGLQSLPLYETLTSDFDDCAPIASELHYSPLSLSANVRVSRYGDEVLFVATSTSAGKQADEQAEMRTRRLQEVTAALSGAATVEQIVGVALNQALPAASVDGGAVWLPSKISGCEELVGYLGPHQPSGGQLRPTPHVDLSDGRQLDSWHHAMWIESAADWEKARAASVQSYRTQGIQSLARIPLSTDGRSMGNIEFSYLTARTFSVDDRSLMVAMSQLVAQALDRARLYSAERVALASAQSAEARYRSLFERSADAVLVVDDFGSFREANPAALALLGRNSDELESLWLAELVTDASSLITIMAGSLQDHGSWQGEFELRRRDGQLIPIEARATSIVTPDGTAVMITARDISDRRAIERLQEEFFSSISHDLKNPLAALRGQVQLLQRRAHRKGTLDLDELQPGLGTIENVGNRMTGMIDELVDVAQLRSGHRLRLRRQRLDLVEISRQRVHEHQLSTLRHTISFESPHETVVGWWDEPRLERVIDNLLTNAIKYSQGGHISVRLSRQVQNRIDMAELTIEDFGVGIPANDLPHIFERFRRGSNVLDHFTGTGLGLSGVHQIVVQHGGSVVVASDEAVGTKVTVQLPIAEPGVTKLRDSDDYDWDLFSD